METDAGFGCCAVNVCPLLRMAHSKKQMNAGRVDGVSGVCGVDKVLLRNK